MKRLFAIAAIATSATLSLTANVTPVVSEAKSFALYTSDALTPTYADALPEWKITYRANETVSITPPNSGTAIQLSGADGLITFTPTSGGVWTLTNSNGETARVGVGWTANNGAPTAVSDTATFGMHTEGDGPNRRIARDAIPPVAYTGDNWGGDSNAAVSVTITPPSGTDATTLDLTGTGTTQFEFNKPGKWKVEMKMADESIHTAYINLPAGFVIRFL